MPRKPKNEICMPTTDYMEEHKKLIALLDEIAVKAKAEATAQTQEVQQRRGRGRPKKCVNDVDGGCGMCGGSKGAKPKKWIQEAVKTMKKGAFTKQALRADETPKEYAEDVLAHPEKHTKTTKKRAQFLKNIMKGGNQPTDQAILKAYGELVDMENPTKEWLYRWTQRNNTVGFDKADIDYLLEEKSIPTGGSPYHVRNNLMRQMFGKYNDVLKRKD